MSINRKTVKRLLENGSFEDLFIEELGWDEFRTALVVDIEGTQYELKPIAHKRGLAALHCACMPESAIRAKIENKVSRDIREHIIIFTDEDMQKQRWQWVRRIPNQPMARREHEYNPNQPASLIQKILHLEVSMDEEENLLITDVNERAKKAFDIDDVTKKFYDRFQKEHKKFLSFIKGISEVVDARWYASVMLNRLMFIYFIQKKGFLDNDTHYLRNRLVSVQERKGKDKFHTFYRYFLMKLCHEALGKEKANRELDADLIKLIGDVPYLNGGIFQPHELELKYTEISIEDDAFRTIFNFFDQFEWHLDTRPNALKNEINPDVLGYIFEKYINQKQMGAYYTKEDITEYISKNTIIPCLFDKAKDKCSIAFEGETSIWKLLQDDPDRYIYPAVRHGVTYDIHSDCERDEPVPYPDNIAVGLDTEAPDLLERRKDWNTPTPGEAALPTEIWRETIARRQRYADVKEKLSNGEVTSINDLITYNLDIRQFAQDVIERCESPDLLNAFWVAIAGRLPQNSNESVKPGITVLDPTCGSGAFLFAALNILEPLYEACLVRMAGFLAEWREAGTESDHRNYARFFQTILDDIDKHPSREYFIYKSIIINNLFGVDIMKEAVEICKLRLFLKLVAQVDDRTRIEPLPDIDFNIRAGNTLVGFATLEQLKNAMATDLLAYSTELPLVLERAEEIERLYDLFRQCQLENDKQTDAKNELSAKLAKLEVQLNRYLAKDYGIDPAKPTCYEAFLESHRPFHWFIEFYGIMKKGGFDAIIGNPPYLEKGKLEPKYCPRSFGTEDCRDIYAWVVERAFSLSYTDQRLGLIVPVSISSSGSFHSLRQILDEASKTFWVSHFANRPGQLFSGAQNRLTILLSVSGQESPEYYSSRYHRWDARGGERAFLFEQISYSRIPHGLSFHGLLPKVGDPVGLKTLVAVLSQGPKTVDHHCTKNSSHKVYWVRVPGYFCQFFTSAPQARPEKGGPSRDRGELNKISLNGANDACVFHAILNSSIYFVFFSTYTDCRHINPTDVKGFPVDIGKLPENTRDELVRLSRILAERMEENKTFIRKSGLLIDSCDSTKLKPVLNSIDQTLVSFLELSDEELDYIINYDIKYRMGSSLFEEDV